MTSFHSSLKYFLKIFVCVLCVKWITGLYCTASLYPRLGRRAGSAKEEGEFTPGTKDGLF